MKFDVSVDVDVEVTEDDAWVIDHLLDEAAGHHILNAVAGGIFDQIVDD